MTYFFRRELIRKFNDNHDEKGRFASGSSSGAKSGYSSLGQRMVDAGKAGGFTFDSTGSTPSSGFSVGGYAPSLQVPVEQLTAQHVSDWLAKNKDILANPNYHAGGWVDNGTFYMDVVRIFPANQKAEAVAAGAKMNQISIADLGAIHAGNWDAAFINTGGNGVDKMEKDDVPLAPGPMGGGAAPAQPGKPAAGNKASPAVMKGADGAKMMLDDGKSMSPADWLAWAKGDVKTTKS